MGKAARYIRPFAVLAGSALALTACGGGSAGSADDGELTYWSMWKEGEPQQLVIADAIADFEEQTGTKVDVQWQGRSNSEKLVPALNTRNVPDLVDGPHSKLAAVLGETGQALPLTDAYAMSVGEDTVADVIPEKYQASTALQGEDGEPWMLPYSVNSDGIWFNAAEFPELSENPPATWEEFIQLLDDLKADGKVPVAADGDIAGYNSFWFTTSLIRIDGPGAFKELAADKSGAGWDAPEVLEAAKKVEELVKGGYLIDGYGASKWPAQQQEWASGNAALMFNGSWLPTETGTYAADGFEYSSFPFPTIDGNETSARADFVGWAVPKKSDDQEAAQELAAFLLNTEYQDAFGADAKVLPIRSDVEVSPELAMVKKSLDEAPSTYLQNDGVTFPGYVEKVFWPLDDQLFLGKITAEEFVAQMKEAQIAYWKDNG